MVEVAHAEPGDGREQRRADEEETAAGGAQAFVHVGSLPLDGPVQADAAEDVAAGIHLTVAGAVEQR